MHFIDCPTLVIHVMLEIDWGTKGHVQKINFKKAYDSVKRRFLDLVMNSKGFGVDGISRL